VAGPKLMLFDGDPGLLGRATSRGESRVTREGKARQRRERLVADRVGDVNVATVPLT